MCRPLNPRVLPSNSRTAAGCLEFAGQGGLQKYKGALRTQKSLDTTFWKYQLRDPDSNQWRSIHHHGINPHQFIPMLEISIKSPPDIFLDFLYPRKYLTAVLNSKMEMDNMNLDKRSRVHNLVGSYSPASYSRRQLAGRISRINASRNLRRAHSSAISYIIKRNSSTVSQTRIDRDYDRMWELWKTGSQEAELRSRLMAYFSGSERSLDIERALSLFGNINTSKRSVEDYEIVIEPLLKAGHLSAVEHLCEDAVTKGLEIDVWSLALKTAIQCSKWQELSRIWSKSHLMIHDSSLSILSTVKGLPSHVNSFLEFLEEHPTTSSDLELASHLLYFVFKSERLMRNITVEKVLSMTRRSSNLGILDHNHYHEAISTSLRIGIRPTKVMSIILYRNMRWQLATYRPEPQLLQQLLKTLASLHTHHGVQFLLDEFSHFHGQPSVEGFKSALVAFSRSGNVSKTQEIFDKLVATYGTSTKNPLVDHKTPKTPRWVIPLLHAHARLGDYPAAEREFNRISHIYKVNQNILCWNTLLSAYANARNYKGAVRVWRRMHRKGQKPDWYTYGTMMSLCARMGDIENTLALCKRAEKRPGNMPAALMDTVVEVYCRNQRLQEAENVAETCLTFALDGSRTRMWNVLLWSHAFRADLDSVSRIHNRMKEADIEFDAMSYSALMLSFVIVGQPDSARRLLRGLQRGRRIQATEFQYTLVLYGYAKQGNRDMVYLIYKEMEQRFKNPSMSARLLMMRATLGRDTLVESHDVDNPEDSGLRLALSEDLLFKAVFDFDRRQFASKHPRPATSSLPMHEAFPAIFYEPVLKTYSAEGMHQRAQKLLKEYSKDIETAITSGGRTIIPSLRFLSVLMEIYMQAENFDTVQKCWEIALQRASNMLLRPTIPSIDDLSHSILKSPPQSVAEDISQLSPENSAQSMSSSQTISEILSSSSFERSPQSSLNKSPKSISTDLPHSNEDLAPEADNQSSGGESYTPEKTIIPAQRYILSRHFSLYIGTMGRSGQAERLPELVKDYQKRGFLMTSQNWLTYVRALATSNTASEQLEAFSTFERIFMPNFPGWRRLARGVQFRPPGVPSTADLLDKRPLGKFRDSLGKKASRLWSKLNPTWMYPTYNVMIYLAATLKDFKERSLVEGREQLDILHSVAPLTLEAIDMMPHLREKFQGVLLRNQVEQGDIGPQKREKYVWTGGILNVGGGPRSRRPIEEHEVDLEEFQSEMTTSTGDQTPPPEFSQATDASEGNPEEYVETTEDRLEPHDEHDIEIETLIELRRRETGVDPIEEEEISDI